MASPSDNNELRTAEDLISLLQTLRGSRCPGCGTEVRSRPALMNLVMGFRQAPRCLSCLASALDREVPTLESSLLAHIQSRDCYRVAWEWAEPNEPTAEDRTAPASPSKRPK